MRKQIVKLELQYIKTLTVNDSKKYYVMGKIISVSFKICKL